MLRYMKKLNSKKIPGPSDVPFLGNLWRYKLGLEEQSSYHVNLNKLYDQYGPVVRQRLGAETVIHIFSPNDVSNLYAKEEKTPTIKPLQETVQFFRKKANITLGLGNSNGEEWYRLRSSLKPIMLTRGGSEHFIPGTANTTDELMKKLETKRKKDNSIPYLMTILGAWTLEAAGLMCFGKRLGYLAENEKDVLPLLRANRAIFYMTTHLKFSTLLYRHFSLPKWKCLEASENYIMKETIKLTSKAVDTLMDLSSKNELKDDSFYLLRQLISNENLNRTDIQVLVQSLFTDSLSTTVPILTFCLYILSKEPRVQEKTYEELSKFINKDTVFTHKTLDNLLYTKALIKETFRLYPNGTEVSRILHKGFDLSGYQIPADTHVHLNMAVHFRSDKEFQQPSEVMPERWLRSEQTQKVNPFLLTPFGHGTRTCMGRRFAEHSLQIALAKILLKYKLKYKENTEPVKQIYNILVYPTDARGILFEPRN